MARTVIVTGASRGIGRSTAQAFLKQGDRVVVCYHTHREEAAALEEAFPGLAAAYGCDMGNPGEIPALAQFAKERFGPVDILVNNAAIARQQLFIDMTACEWQRIWQTNVTGPMLLAQALLPDMINLGRGWIINISSVWGLRGASCEVAYSSTKAALIGFTQALAKEVGLMGIRVNAVAPGVIDTDMIAGLSEDTRKELSQQAALGRLGTPDDVARAVLFLASPQAEFITGAILPVDGGFIG